MAMSCVRNLGSRAARSGNCFRSNFNLPQTDASTLYLEGCRPNQTLIFLAIESKLKIREVYHINPIMRPHLFDTFIKLNCCKIRLHYAVVWQYNLILQRCSHFHKHISIHDLRNNKQFVPLDCINYLHAIKPPWQPTPLLKEPRQISMSFSHANSSGTPPPFSPQTSVPCALKKQLQTLFVTAKICKKKNVI